jgi:starch synthase
MLSDQWSTVSRSYRDEILHGSPLADILRQKPQPFAHPNGIPIAERVRKLDAVAPDHLTAKAQLQKKYFSLPALDDSVALFAFVGRVTTQKGVHLILEIAERIIMKSNYKVQFLVGGPANMREPYAADCAHKMWHLKAKYPACFWAAPEEFFTDGALVNRGADFGLMPSAFEPGGIVQHEFFVGCTPVVAFKTGGLKDSVLEYMWATEEGTGYTFESYSSDDFVFAMERALGTFRNK